MIPVLIVRDITEAVAVLTEVLDFDVAFPPGDSSFYAVLKRGADELHLNLAHAERSAGGGCCIVVVEDVDVLFASFLSRGLVVPSKANSPVHSAPVDQSWGTRELYVDDPSGNTLIFQQR